MNEALPKIVTAIPGPKSQALNELRKKVIAQGVSTSSSVFPAKASGALITDVDGNVFLDFTAGIGVVNSGHCDPAMVAAIKEQVDKYIHTCSHVFMNEPYIKLAEKLIEIAPGPSEKRAILVNTGAEAVENSIKIARKYTQKQGILSLEYAFHGRSYMAMSITSKYKPYKNGFGPFMTDTFKVPAAYCYRCPYGIAAYPECGLACAERIRTLLKAEISADTIAALIVEPVQGEGGFIVPPKAYMQALQSICNENNIVFIVDEIQSGFARTGYTFASDYFEIEPDLMTVAKGIANGMPLSAVIGKKDIMDAPLVGGLGGTYGGNPVSTNAALALISRMENEMPANAQRLNATLVKRLNEMKNKYDIIGDVRGLGAMIATEFVLDRKTKEPNADIVKKVISYAEQKGVVFMSAGLFGNVIRFLPPLVMTDEQLNYGMDILDEAIGTSK